MDASGHMRLTPAGSEDLEAISTNPHKGRLSIRDTSNNTSMLQLEHTTTTNAGYIKMTSRSDAGGEDSAYLGKSDTQHSGYIPITYLGSHSGYNNMNMNVTASGFVGVGT